MVTLNRIRAWLPALGSAVLLSTTSWAKETAYINGVSLDGVRSELAVDRTPALYSGDFGDCLGGQSLLNVTKLDAAFYFDNSTISWHLDGNTNLRSEKLMNRVRDPGLRGLRPDPALRQLEPVRDCLLPGGHAEWRLLSQPAAVSSILGIFTVVAIIASFAAAAYGVSIPHMRTHYAHSFSVLIIFETFQSVFFSGALSLQWPSVLPAWWSNFAWSAGLIPVSNMVDSVNKFAGISGNGSQVGGAGSTIINNNGGLIQQIYGRSLDMAADLATEVAPLVRREPYNPDDPYDYNWGGNPLNIPAPDALMLTFLWLIIALCIITGLIAIFKFSLERLAKQNWIQRDRLEFFRNNWVRYLRATLLRTLFIAFFSMMVLSLYQFNLRDRAGPVAIAAIVFLLFLLGFGSIAVYALRCRLHSATFTSEPDRILFVSRKVMWYIPWFTLVRLSQLREKEFDDLKPVGSLPFVHWYFAHHGDKSAQTKVHEDDTYIKRFGWLSARYRASRWWYFVFWMSYQFVRALFIGAAAQSPMAQVFGLFIVDILAMVVISAVNPYEGQRNTAVAVWILGLVKIATTGLSIAFLPELALNRMVATAIGVIVIVIQALLVIAVMILVILGGISSWMSLYRNREYFSSERLEGTRIKYYEHIAKRALDEKAPLPVEKKKRSKKCLSKSKAVDDDEEKAIPKAPSEPYFSVRSVRRMTKIEDEDEENMSVMESTTFNNTNTSSLNVYNANDNATDYTIPYPPPLRRASLSSRHSASSLPRAARVHRASWSSRDFLAMQSAADLERPDTARANRHSRSFSAGVVHTTTTRFNPNATAGGGGGGGAAAAMILRDRGSLPSLRAGGGIGGNASSSRPVTPVMEDTAEDPDLHVGGHLDEQMFRKNLDHWVAGEEDRESQKSERAASDAMVEKAPV
ncbi:TRP-like ion channel [Apiospora saccharicola]